MLHELDLSSAKRRIVAFIKRKVEESQARAVLGISGGIDSLSPRTSAWRRSAAGA